MKHKIQCVKDQLYRAGQYLLNEKPDSSEFQKGRGDGLLRALALLEGRITGDSTYISQVDCKCGLKPAYDHYELANKPTKEKDQ